jgi:hypothetical protein
VLPRKLEYLRVGGMIGIFDRDDGPPELRIFIAKIARELLLGLRRSDQQDFMGPREGMGDIIEEVMIRGRSVSAMRALSAVNPLVLILRVNPALFLFRGVEVPCGCVLMIDPNNRMVV